MLQTALRLINKSMIAVSALPLLFEYDAVIFFTVLVLERLCVKLYSKLEGVDYTTHYDIFGIRVRLGPTTYDTSPYTVLSIFNIAACNAHILLDISHPFNLLLISSSSILVFILLELTFDEIIKLERIEKTPSD